MTVAQHDLQADFERLARNGFCQDPLSIASEGLRLLTPPERISITECASKYRLIPNAEGGERLWSATLTPYVNGIQDAIDDPKIRVIVVVGPARSGKTLASENALFKRMKFGPMTDVLWYLPGALLDDYLDTTVTPMFDMHPDIAAKLGPKPSDRKRNLKKVGTGYVRYFAANKTNIAGKQAPFIHGDEIDLYPKAIRSNFRQQIALRQRAYGNIGKGYLCSHPDAGWKSGIAGEWKESTRGIYYWPCPHCEGWSSPCPTAEHRTTLSYTRPNGMADDDMLDTVEATAHLICPHCGAEITEDAKPAMLAAGEWVFDGQQISEDGIVSGEMRSGDTAGFWIHGTMSPFVTWGRLAREYVGALAHYEKTRDPERLKQVVAKSLGEVYQGGDADTAPMEAVALEKNIKDETYDLGTVPDGVLYLTAAVDPGGRKFDVSVIGWGHDGESWLIDRFNITKRNGLDIRPPERQADWLALEERVLKRVYPLASDPTLGLGIAGMAIDTGGQAGSTPKAREFARQMLARGVSGKNGYRVRLIKGSRFPRAPEIGTVREINRDDKGKKMVPAVTERDLGVYRIKKVMAARLRVTEPGPGFMHVPHDAPKSVYSELCAEVLVDDVWERHGDNETWDLWVYCEGVRQLLQPDRKEINWSARNVPWARYVPIRQVQARPAPAIADTAPAPAQKRKSGLERLAALNAKG